MKGIKLELSTSRKVFFDTAVGDVLRAMDGLSLVGAFVLSLCVIDYLSFLKSSEPTEREVGENYKSMTKEYLNIRPEKKYDPEWLWKLRNALIHNYGPAKIYKDIVSPEYQLTDLESKYHLEKTREGATILNVESFVTDIVWCAKIFFDDAKNGKLDRNTIEENGDKLLRINISGYDESIKERAYRSLHESLKELDKTTPEYYQLFSDIEERLKHKKC